MRDPRGQYYMYLQCKYAAGAPAISNYGQPHLQLPQLSIIKVYSAISFLDNSIVPPKNYFQIPSIIAIIYYLVSTCNFLMEL